MNWSNQAANIIQKLRLIFLLLSISGIVKARGNTFRKYEYEYKLYLPYSLLWIGEKNLTGTFKNHLSRNSKQQSFLKIYSFTGTFKGFCQNIPELLFREVHLSVTPFSDKFMVIFRNIVIIFLGRITPNYTFLWHRCWNRSFTNLKQLIFTWKDGN